MGDSPPIGVLFVCMGNICRSPLAEGLFRHKVAARGVVDLFDIDSAGTGGWHAGAAADHRMRAAATRHGVTLDSVARQVRPGDFDRFDHLLCADEENRSDLLDMGAPPGKTRLLLAIDPSATVREVPDPYYGGDDGFELVYELVDSACDALLTELLAERERHAVSERDALVAAALAAGIDADISSVAELTGGCIHRVVKVDFEDAFAVVAKIADEQPILEEEAASLEALAATKTVPVPEPLAVGVFSGRAVLLMSYLPPAAATADAWRGFGRRLAALHACDAGTSYGFSIDNHLGATPQPNGPLDDWVEFNAERRLGHQVRLAARNGRLEDDERRRLERVIDQLERYIPRKPRPSLLHGDLWSGNAVPTVDGEGRTQVAVIDPACSVGDGLADIAMMRLFGGFPAECYSAYAGAREQDDDRIETRVAVYQLYHLLNHLNLFGRGYAAQVNAVAGGLR